MKRTVLVIAALLGIQVIAGLVAIYSGLYNVAADEKHWTFTQRLLETVVARSVERRAGDIEVPDLANANLVLQGAGRYAEMCAACHLAPGAPDSPMRIGMYPRPPELAERRVDAQAAFWIIKHGVKMTGMPAWGLSHEDADIWGLVAFVSRLPGMSPQQYRDLVANAPADEHSAPAAGAKYGHKQSEAPAAGEPDSGHR